MKNFFVVGTNHKFAPLKVRQNYSFTKEKIEKLYKCISESGTSEIFVLSTCNRTEIYCHGRFEDIYKLLFATHHDFYVYFNKDALAHLFRVVSGLDSQIVGENEIVSQFKDSFKILSRHRKSNLFQTIYQIALEVSKEIRTKTEISKGKVSIGSVCAEKIKEFFNDTSDVTVLLIGFGKTGELVLKHLEKLETKKIFLTNRTFEKVEKALNELKKNNVIGVKFDKFKDTLDSVDCIISTVTTDGEYILKAAEIPSNVKLIVDLSVPISVENCGTHEFINLEKLQSIIDLNVASRVLSVKDAEKIIEEKSIKYWNKISKILEKESKTRNITYIEY